MNYLSLPPNPRLHLISPPGSPPRDWVPVLEGEPNRRVLAEDLEAHVQILRGEITMFRLGPDQALDRKGGGWEEEFEGGAKFIELPVKVLKLKTGMRQHCSNRSITATSTPSSMAVTQLSSTAPSPQSLQLSYSSSMTSSSSPPSQLASRHGDTPDIPESYSPLIRSPSGIMRHNLDPHTSPDTTDSILLPSLTSAELEDGLKTPACPHKVLFGASIGPVSDIVTEDKTTVNVNESGGASLKLLRFEQGPSVLVEDRS